MTKTVRGYYIYAQRGDKTELKHAWGEKGKLPQEWDATKDDPTVEKAQVFSSTQRRRQHQYRRILDSYSA